MTTLLPIWNYSPLDQFSTRNLFILKADLLGNLQISLTNIGLYLIIATIIIFMFYIFISPNAWSLSMESICATVQYYLTPSIPKPHDFIVIALKSSSMAYATATTVTVSIITVITQNSTYAWASLVFLNTLILGVGILTPYLIETMNEIIRGLEETYIRVSTEFYGPGLSYPMLNDAYAYLTPYLRNISSLFSLLHRIVGFFVGSPELNQMQDLYNRFLTAARNLMLLYRQIEERLGIPLDSSPISLQVWGL